MDGAPFVGERVVGTLGGAFQVTERNSSLHRVPTTPVPPTAIQWGAEVHYTLEELEKVAKQANLTLLGGNLSSPSNNLTSNAPTPRYNPPNGTVLKHNPLLAPREYRDQPYMQPLPTKSISNLSIILPLKRVTDLSNVVDRASPSPRSPRDLADSANTEGSDTGEAKKKKRKRSAISGPKTANGASKSKSTKRSMALDADEDSLSVSATVDGSEDGSEIAMKETVPKATKRKKGPNAPQSLSNSSSSIVSSGNASVGKVDGAESVEKSFADHGGVNGGNQASHKVSMMANVRMIDVREERRPIGRPRAQSKPPKPARTTFRIYLSQFPVERKNEIAKKVKKLKDDGILSISLSETVRGSTHFVSFVDHKTPNTPVAINLMLAIVRGVWILEEKWVKKLIKHSKIPKAEKYEMTALTGPKRARIARAARIAYLESKGLTKDDGDDDAGDLDLPRLVFSDWAFNLDTWKGEPGTEMLKIILTYGAALVVQKFEADIWFTNADAVPEPVFSESEPISEQDSLALALNPQLRKRHFASSHTKRCMPTFALSLDWLRDSIISYEAQDPNKYSNKIRRFNAI